MERVPRSSLLLCALLATPVLGACSTLTTGRFRPLVADWRHSRVVRIGGRAVARYWTATTSDCALEFPGEFVSGREWVTVEMRRPGSSPGWLTVTVPAIPPEGPIGVIVHAVPGQRLPADLTEHPLHNGVPVELPSVPSYGGSLVNLRTRLFFDPDTPREGDRVDFGLSLSQAGRAPEVVQVTFDLVSVETEVRGPSLMH